VDLRVSAALLKVDAAVRAHDGDIDESLESVRTGLNVGRSLGDDPFLLCQLIRIACGSIAVKTLERTLGQGEPSNTPLIKVAKQLAREEAEIGPAIRTALRAARAELLLVLEKITNGELSVEELALSRRDSSLKGTVYRWAWERPVVSLNRRTLLRFMSPLIPLVEIPRSQRALVLDEFNQELANAKRTIHATSVIAWRLLPAVPKILDAHDRYQAILRTARVAIAVERYRLAHKDRQWPECLDQLVPSFLDKVPTDPFDDQPIRYRRVGKDVVIYSVGLDGVDDGGFFDPENATLPGTDIVFRLYHPDNRGVPAKPKPPPELPDVP
jgi:hypothetical protein